MKAKQKQNKTKSNKTKMTENKIKAFDFHFEFAMRTMG